MHDGSPKTNGEGPMSVQQTVFKILIFFIWPWDNTIDLDLFGCTIGHLRRMVKVPCLYQLSFPRYEQSKVFKGNNSLTRHITTLDLCHFSRSHLDTHFWHLYSALIFCRFWVYLHTRSRSNFKVFFDLWPWHFWMHDRSPTMNGESSKVLSLTVF